MPAGEDDIWGLTKKMRGEEDDNAFSYLLRFHETYSNRIYGDNRSLIERYVDDSQSGKTKLDRQSYINAGIRDRYTDNKITQDMASEMLAQGAFTSFNADVHSLLMDGKASLKRLMGHMDVGASSLDIPTQAYQSTLDRVAYETFFNVKRDSKGNYKGLARSTDAGLSESRRKFLEGIEFFRDRFLERAANADDLYLVTGGARPSTYMGRDMKGNDFFSFLLLDEANEDRLRGVSRSLSNQQRIRREMARLYGSREYEPSMSRNYLDNRSYINKPGIAPIVALFDSAEREITIDLYQLQNTVIEDVLYRKLLDKRDDIARGDFRFNLKLALVDEGATGSTGRSILGPNIIELEKFRMLRDAMIEAAPDQASKTRIMENFRILVDTRKNHSKIYATESYAGIGSFNLTQPVGSSIHQEGSTYEALRILHLSDDLKGINLDDPTQIGEYVNGRMGLELQRLLAQGVSEGLAREQVRKDVLRRVSSAKLYSQLRYINSNTFSDNYVETNKQFHTNMTNIGGSGDIYNFLKTTLDYLTVGVQDPSTGIRKNENAKLLMNLDQVYLLNYDRAQRAGALDGEMGPFLDKGGKRRGLRTKKYTQLQDRLFELVLGNRAQIVVDVRNYREKVLNPTYDRVLSILGDQFYREYGGSLERLVGRGTTEERQQRLVSRFDALGAGTATRNRDLIKQLLVVTSGNIKLSTQPRQHLKSFAVYEGDLSNPSSARVLAYYMGSSNLGVYSLAMGIDDDEDRVSNEFGILIGDPAIQRRRPSSSLLNRMRGVGLYELSDEELHQELSDAGINVYNQWRHLTASDPFTPSQTRAFWENRVDRIRLNQLTENLRSLTRDLGLSDGAGIEFDYILGGASGSERVGINLSINSGAITGMGSQDPSQRMQFRITTLRGPGNSDGFVYFLDEGKVVGNARFINSSGDNIALPYAKGGKLGSGEMTILDPIQNTTMMVASLVGEMVNRSLVWGPQQYLLQQVGTDGMGIAVAEYFEYLATGKRQGGNWLMGARDADIEHLQNKLRSKFIMEDQGSALVKVRQFTGNTDAANIAREQMVNKALEYLEEARLAIKEGPKGTLIDRDARHMALSKLTRYFMNLDMNQQRELALEIVSSRGDLGYTSFIKQSMNEFRKALFEDKLLRGQASTYGGPQAWFKQSLYGVGSGSQYQKQVELRSLASKSKNTLARVYAYMTSPYTYGPTQDLMKPGDIRGVAEGGTSSPGSNELGGVTSFGMSKQSLGDVMDVNAISFMGIGHITYREQLRRYFEDELGLDSVRANREIDKIFTGSGDKPREAILTYTFNNKKASQIPQRLKNVMGSRPLSRLRQDMVDEMMSVPLDLRGEVMSKHVEKNIVSLKDQVKTLMRNARDKRGQGTWSDTYIDETVEDVVNSDYKVWATFDGGIRSVLGSEASQIIDQVRQRVLDELGVSEEELEAGDLDTVSTLVTGRLMVDDVLSGGLKGFTSNSKTALAFVQLGGAYTDYYWANPNYGGPNGMREGFLDRTQKRLKSSMLKADWHDAGGNVIAREGDYIAFDPERDKVVVVSGGKVKQTLNLSDIRESDVQSAANESVSALEQRIVFNNIADNYRRGKESSWSNLGKAVWSRPGEDGAEYLLSMNQLVGNPDNNELVFEFMDVRFKKAGSGVRTEGIGGLFKGVAAYYGMVRTPDGREIDPTEEMLDQHREKFQDGDKGMTTVMHELFKQGIRSQDIFGMINPSNLKSYFYTHGSEIVRRKELKRSLLKMEGKYMAAGLMLAFGTGFLSNEDTSRVVQDMLHSTRGGPQIKSRSLEGLLYELSYRGELGTHLKSMARMSALMDVREKDVQARMREILSSEPRAYSGMEDSALRERAYMEIQGKGFLANTKNSFSAIQTPALLKLNTEDIVRALVYNDGPLVEKVKSIVDLSRIKSTHIEYTDPGQRSAAMVAAGLDIIAQTIRSTNTKIRHDVPIDTKDPNSRKVLYQLASVMGLSTRRMEEDKDYEEQVAATLRELVGNVPSIMLYIDIATSQSKESIGKKYEGNLEYQHLLKPLMSQARAFKEGGKLSSLRMVMANIVAAGFEGETAMSAFTDEIWKQSDIYDVADINLRSGKVKAMYMGIYGNLKMKGKINTLRKAYQRWAALNEAKVAQIQDSIKEQFYGYENEHGVRIKGLKDIEEQKRRDGDSEVAISNWKRMGNKFTTKIRKHMRDMMNLIVTGDAMIDLTDLASDTEEDKSLKRQLRSMYPDRSIINVTQEIEEIAREYELDSDKEFSVGQSKAILEALDESGHKSIAMYLPSIAGYEQGDDGRVRVIFDYTNKFYTYVPSGKDLNALGVSFGSYMDELVKDTITLSQGLTIGTTTGRALDQLARNRMVGLDEIEIAQEELQDVIRYWDTASAITMKLADASSQTRLQKALAGENRLSGAVTTPVSSFLVPSTLMVMPKEILRRHGAYLNPRRMELLRATTDALSGLRVSQGDEAGKLRRMFYRAQRDALRLGMSQEGMSLLNSVKDESSRLRSMVDKIERTSNMDEKREAIHALYHEATTMKYKWASVKSSGRGDRYASVMGRVEAEYWLNISKSMAFHNDVQVFGRKISSTEMDKVKSMLSIFDPKSSESLGVAVDGFNIGTNLRRGDSSNLGRIVVDDFMNSVRGREGVYEFDRDHYRKITSGLSDRQKQEFLSRKLDMMIADFKSVHKRMVDRQSEIPNVLRSMLMYTEDVMTLSDGREINTAESSAYSATSILTQRLEKLKGELNPLQAVDIEDHLNNVSGKVEDILTQFDTVRLAEALAFRSPPPGNTELYRQTLGVIRDLAILNEYTTHLENNSDQSFFRYDEGRGRTLSMFSPISITTLNGGDFDGDSYTSIFSSIMDMEQENEKARDWIARNDIELRSLDKEIGDLRSRVDTLSRGSIIIPLSSMNRQQKTQLADDINNGSSKLEDLLRRREELLEANKREKDKLTLNKIKMVSVRKELDKGEFGSAMRKQVANYMGINKSFFEGGESGFQSNSVNTDVLFTFLEQGYGLFGGLHNKGDSISRLISAMDNIFIDPEGTNEGYVKLRTSREAIEQAIRNLSEQQGPDNGFYTTLRYMTEVREDLVEQVEAAVGQFTNVDKEILKEDYMKAVSSVLVNVNNKFEGLRASQGILGQGAGLSMGLTTYDMLVKVLGKAGSDILGKSYNSIIATLFADSPMIALGHVFKSNETLSAQVKQQMDDYYGEGTGDQLFSKLNSSIQQVEGLHAYMQNIHQLLRDAIKFKNDNNLLGQLESLSNRYNATSDESEKRRLVTDIASHLGPGPGMSALMSLHELVANREVLRGGGASNKDQVRTLLRETFGISVREGGETSSIGEGGEYTRDLSDFDRLAHEMTLIAQAEGRAVPSQWSAYEVASYKVSRDLQNMVIAFRYEKASASKAFLEYVNPGFMGSVMKKSRSVLGSFASKLGFDIDNNDEIRRAMAEDADLFKQVTALTDAERERVFTDKNVRSRLVSVLGVKEEDLDSTLRQLDEDPTRNSAKQALLLSIINETESQTLGFMGAFGERMDRFVSLSQARQMATGMMEGRSGTIISADHYESDIFLSMLNLATSGKLTGEAQATFFASLIDGLDLVGLDGKDPKDQAMMIESALIRRQTMDAVAYRKGGDYSTINDPDLGSLLGKLYDLPNLNIQIDDSHKTYKTIANPEDPNEVLVPAGAQMIVDQLQETGTSLRNKTVAQFFHAYNQVQYRRDNKPVKTWHEVAMGMVNDAEDYDTIHQIINIGHELGVTPDYYMEEYDVRMKQYDKSSMVDNKLMQDSFNRAQRTSGMADLLLPAALSIMGGAIMDGSISNDALMGVAGSTVMALGYMKADFAKRSALAFGGSAWKFNAALQESEDPGEGISRYIAREVGFALGATVAAPMVQGLIDGTMLRGIAGPIKRGESPLSKRLKAGSVLDVDRFANAKALSGTLSGAILSAAMGMFMAGAADQMVASSRPSQLGGVIDHAIRAAQNTAARLDSYRVEAEALQGVDVSDEMGGGVDAYAQVDPVQSMQESAIDPIKDNEWTWSVPGYIHAGVTLTGEELMLGEDPSSFS